MTTTDTTTNKPASAKQRDYIAKLAGERALTFGDDFDAATRLAQSDDLSSRDASRLIDYLLSQPIKRSAIADLLGPEA